LELELADTAVRLSAATVAGAILGINRDLAQAPIGARTLGLVALGSATVTVATIQVPGMAENTDALSRVVQGVIQGVMAGISFIGAGVILRIPQEQKVEGLTTAAAVWVTAALGIACGLGHWPTVLIAATLAVFLLAGMTWLRDWFRGEKPDAK
jgi:putative Mg2+ transporter-C (MgtC) family protein